MKKRALSLLLAVIMVFGLLPVTVHASYLGSLDNGLSYRVHLDHVEIEDYFGDSTSVVVPAVIEGLPVTAIGDHAFSQCTNLTSIELPDSITSIGVSAFSYCESLTGIDLPGSITSIGNTAFNNCTSLTSIDLPDGITSIGDFTFNTCTNLTSIDLPDSITSIGEFAFDSCTSLTSIDLPDSITSIGRYAFSYCDSLTNIDLPDSITSIGDNAFTRCSSLTSIDLPDGITFIDKRVFDHCTSLTNIDLPDSITSIGDNAFNYCSSLTSIDLPEGITSIGDWAFDHCTGLTSIDLPDSVTSIGLLAFAYCDNLTSIYFNGNAPEFGDRVFYDTTATAYYPANNPTWTDDVMRRYGGIITWVPYSPNNPFTDVPVGSYFEEPVLWALENDITTGTSATTFSPGGLCLRAHVVTFLHRSVGSPAPTASNPFTDVKSSDFFYAPVLWAVENGITNGVSATEFGSGAVCNRAAVVTFLWRAAGSPEPESTVNPFTDVKPTDFFYKSVLWAVENGITNGLSSTEFGPGAACNRAQVVTFLYRANN